MIRCFFRTGAEHVGNCGASSTRRLGIELSRGQFLRPLRGFHHRFDQGHP